MLFIFPEIPRLVHPCYLGRMSAPDNKEDNVLVRCRYFYLENRFENQYNTVELAIISKSLELLGAIREIDGENFCTSRALRIVSKV